MNVSVNGVPAFVATGGVEFDPRLPSVVLIHGAGFDHSTWALHSRWFAHHGFSVLVPDLPGHGRSAGLSMKGRVGASLARPAGATDHEVSWKVSRRRSGVDPLSSPRKRGPIRRALSCDCGVWVPGLADARPGRQNNAGVLHAPHAGGIGLGLPLASMATKVKFASVTFSWICVSKRRAQASTWIFIEVRPTLSTRV